VVHGTRPRLTNIRRGVEHVLQTSDENTLQRVTTMQYTVNTIYANFDKIKILPLNCSYNVHIHWA
jgi:hypothetical protein